MISKDVELFIKREDLIHPLVSGNKFRKLKYNILKAKKQKKQIILTFGGAYSNHILATAVGCKLNNLKSIGIIRGEELANDFDNTLSKNPTLKEAFNNKMTFDFVSRQEYRNKNEISFIENLKDKYGDFYLIPEGGTNDLAINGCEEILSNEDFNFDYICCSVGTGGTISGVINSSSENQNIIGFSSLKGDFLVDEIKRFAKKSNWSLNTEFHFGGYAKYSDELISFINDFKEKSSILLDPIYTAKMIYGIFDMIKNDKFEKGSKILAIHTGGIQGINGFNEVLSQKNKQTIRV